ncbi:MAG: Gfo/Idh/MocA family oxidoreductase [Thermoanaerobaculales bacterium]|nr:Gfo/Idh/MocA family oxidoreductase [Thermoanaerobaculales bacterium]
MRRFAISGVAGYVAPRHLKAIRDTGNRLIAAVDPHDSVGILDSYFPDVAFFSEFERFDRHLEKLRRDGEGIDYLSICAPNHLHDAHIRLALRLDADAICEKPLVLNPWNLDALAELENETGQRVFTILQLRVHPSLIELRKKLQAETGKRHQVRLTYITSRGPWYRYSWKGNEGRSGGVTTNIGIHFFDMLMWLFGGVDRAGIHLREPGRAAGTITLDRADVTWSLSINKDDLPFEPEPGKKTTYRSITVDGEEIEFSGGFTDLHTRVYEETIAGRGFGLDDARPSIELVHYLRKLDLVSKPVVVVSPGIAGEVSEV